MATDRQTAGHRYRLKPPHTVWVAPCPQSEGQRDTSSMQVLTDCVKLCSVQYSAFESTLNSSIVSYNAALQSQTVLF